MSYTDIIDEKRRLTILKFLAAENDYAMNTSVVKTLLAQTAGFSESSATILNDFIFLDEQRLIVKSDIHNIVVGKITQRGLDVSTGATRCAGVARPSPD